MHPPHPKEAATAIPQSVEKPKLKQFAATMPPSDPNFVAYVESVDMDAVESGVNPGVEMAQVDPLAGQSY